MEHLKSKTSTITKSLNEVIHSLEEQLGKNKLDLAKSNENCRGWHSKIAELEKQLQIAQKEQFDAEILLKEQLRQLTIVRQQNEVLNRAEVEQQQALVAPALIQELQAKNYAQNDAIQVLTNQYSQLKTEFDSNLHKWEVFELNQPLISEFEDKINQQVFKLLTKAKQIVDLSTQHAEVLRVQEERFETVKKLLIYTQAKLFDK